MTEDDELEETTESFSRMLDNMRAPDTFTFYREDGKAVLTVVSFDGCSVEQMAKDLHEAADQLKKWGYDRSDGRIVPKAH